MSQPVATLTDDEKNRILYHLGYLVPDRVVTIILGFPTSAQPRFLVDSAMNNIPQTAVGIIRQRVAILDDIEQRLVDAMDRFKAEKLGEITLSPIETERLEKEYYRWAMRLADALGVPLNIYSERFRYGGGGVRPMNIPVRN